MRWAHEDRLVLTEYAIIDHIDRHLELKFEAEGLLPSRIFEQVALMATEESKEHK